jgi:hypothetical protein
LVGACRLAITDRRDLRVAADSLRDAHQNRDGFRQPG